MMTSNRDGGVSRLAHHNFRDYVVLMVVAIVASAIVSSEAFSINLSEPINAVPEDFSANTNGQQPFDYAPYLKRVNEPLLESELENILDFNDRNLEKEFNFDPMNILTSLIDKAAAQDTTPEKFYEEIQDLIAFQTYTKSENVGLYESQNVVASTEPTENTENTVVSSTFEPPKYAYSSKMRESVFRDIFKNTSTEYPEATSTERTTTLSTLNTTQVKFSEENSEVALSNLEKKYNISSKCHGSDSITPFRLALMFPHYQNLGQKPFVSTSYTDIIMGTSFSTTTTPDYYYDPSIQTYQNNDGDLSHQTARVPSFFTRHEFGGLIPRSGGLDETARTHIIAIHLYSLYRNEDEGDASVPFRTKCVMVKWRMDRSLVSDDRRIRFLQNNDVLTAAGREEIEIKKLHALVPSDFQDKILWKVFE